MGLCESGIDNCGNVDTDKARMSDKETLESEAGSLEEYASSDSQNNILSQIHFEIKEMRAEISQSISLLLSQKSPSEATNHYTTNHHLQISSSNNIHNTLSQDQTPRHHRYHSSGSSIGSLNLNFDDNSTINTNNEIDKAIPLPPLTPVCSSWDAGTCKIILEHQDPIKQ